MLGGLIVTQNPGPLGLSTLGVTPGTSEVLARQLNPPPFHYPPILLSTNVSGATCRAESEGPALDIAQTV